MKLDQDGFFTQKGGHISMNRKEWDQTMPSILAGLAPGKYSLREIMLDASPDIPRPMRGCFSMRMWLEGATRACRSSGKNVDGACVYEVR